MLPPLIIPSKNGEHQRSIILLHCRGLNAKSFGPEILNSIVAASQSTFAEGLPSTKFVIPSASESQVANDPGITRSQWFDCWSLVCPEEREELSIVGLRKHVSAIHKLVQDEAALVGIDQVCMVGLSQGCACGLIAMLLWEGKPIAAFAGMCGWLPFHKTMTESLAKNDSVVEELSFKVSDGNTQDSIHASQQRASLEPGQPRQRMLEKLRTILDLPTSNTQSLSQRLPPVFLGHGLADNVVPIHLGRDASQFLELVGIKPIWKEYPGLGHWYSPEMLRDVCDLVNAHTHT